MQLINGSILYSASDCNEFLECRHLTSLERDVALGRKVHPPREEDIFADLIRRKGHRHEERYLAKLEATRDVAKIPSMLDEPLEACVEQTLAAMQARKEVIYQACFSDGTWRGQADFLFLVAKPSALGDWSYEVADTKLALNPKPYFLVQLCFYSELLEKVQHAEPNQVHVVLGSMELATYRLADLSAYYRRLKKRFLNEIGNDTETVPIPQAHCGFCRWKRTCEAEWADRDALSLVANIRRSQIDRLERTKIYTLAELAQSDSDCCPTDMDSEIFETLRGQARLQWRERETGTQDFEFLKHPPNERRGFALLPPADLGDVFFDMEGNPLYWNGDALRPMGLEYLFGYTTFEDGEAKFQYEFAADRSAEKRALEAFVDFVTHRRTRNPDLHVYHYAHYEKSTLERLAAYHSTREDEVDELLRAGVLVDLYAVVRQAIRISKPSYSIKKLEAFYRGEERGSGREEAVTGGAESVVAFEKWLDDGAIGEPTEIIAYNKDDCRSTYELVEWLRGLKPEAERELGYPIDWQPVEVKPTSEETKERWIRVARLKSELTHDITDESAKLNQDQEQRLLLAHLLDYNRRELRPAYWSYYRRRDVLTEDELLEDTQSLGKLKLDPAVPSISKSGIDTYTFCFPDQETKLKKSTISIEDPNTEKSPGTIKVLDVRTRKLVLTRKSNNDRPLPSSIIEGSPLVKTHHVDAIVKMAEDFLVNGAQTKYRACADIITLSNPRVTSGTIVALPASASTISDIAQRLDDSYLFVQGPPGSGKTYVGANVILDLLAAGKRVGITAISHKAIDNILHEMEACGRDRGMEARGVKKSSAGDPSTEFDPHPDIQKSLIRSSGSVGVPDCGTFVAVTLYSLPRLGYDLALDYLIIDEAGQVALADALSIGIAAHNLIFLGDPQQLPQVTQGTHRFGSGRSVLEHLLGDSFHAGNVRRIFLPESRRMHPDVCGFISDVVYRGELMSIPECSQRWIELGGAPSTGLRHEPVEHLGCSTRSQAEADTVAQIVRVLLAGRFHDIDGSTRSMEQRDVLVMAPYNAQVNLLKATLHDHGFSEVEVGTVDLFQGREAPAIVYSLTTSTGDDLPRDVAFLFSRNRLNVAISRAQCLAYLVYSPAILELRCSTPTQIELVNATCSFVERGEEMNLLTRMHN